MPLRYLCDNYDDCDDGFDEKNCSTIVLTSPSVMTVEEGAVDGLQFCLTVTGYSNFIDRQYPVESFPIGSAKNGTDYIFYDDVIIFDGFYFVGESECVVVNVTVPDDYLVEGNEVFKVVIDSLDLSPALCVFIIDNDYLRVGFPVSSYTVDESANLIVKVSVLADKNGHITDAGLPLGVRVTSRDGSAVAGEDYEPVLSNVYIRPDRSPSAVIIIYIYIINDNVQEGEERFTLELTAFDLSIVLVNSVVEVVIADDDVALCPHLQAPADGAVRYNDRVVDSVAQYTCDEGFSLVGDDSRTCQFDSTWSGEEPTCQRDEDVCTVELEEPIAVAGNSAAFDIRGVGSNIVSFVCKLDGNQLANCDSPLTGLTSGLHRLRVVPVGCAENQGRTFRFNV
jgi:hypothetical protein